MTYYRASPPGGLHIEEDPLPAVRPARLEPPPAPRLRPVGAQQQLPLPRYRSADGRVYEVDFSLDGGIRCRFPGQAGFVPCPADVRAALEVPPVRVD
jgi:hypothetical protein